MSCNLFCVSFLVTPCLVVALQPCMGWIPIKKKIKYFNKISLASEYYYKLICNVKQTNLFICIISNFFNERFQKNSSSEKSLIYTDFWYPLPHVNRLVLCSTLKWKRRNSLSVNTLHAKSFRLFYFLDNSSRRQNWLTSTETFAFTGIFTGSANRPAKLFSKL